MSRFKLHFDWLPFAKLDQFALKARQDYNLGNDNKWFNCFRGGLFGLRARLKGADLLYADIHKWGKAFTNRPIEIEAMLGSLFFNMASGIECFVFAINSLGYAINPGDFVDISNNVKLRRINPVNIIGDKPLPGYKKYFTQTEEFIFSNKELIKLITDQHNVSKHRRATFQGGKCRFDPPPNFLEAIGVDDNDENRVLFAPYAEIILMREPKIPDIERKTIPYQEQLILEDVAKEYNIFINELPYKTLNDVQLTITPLL
jgi:hypothetical protein